jgi:ribosomal protein S18 acetylase RimI-like enzyme
MTVRVVPPGPERDTYLPLLHLADDSEAQIRGYYQQGDLYVVDDEAGAPLGVVLAVPIPDGSVELKAVAVDASRHNQGFGRRMLAAVLDNLRQWGVRSVVVGTANSSIGALAFYQKVGFRLARIERDFFTPERGYPDGLAEHGIPLRDLVWLELAL